MAVFLSLALALLVLRTPPPQQPASAEGNSATEQQDAQDPQVRPPDQPANGAAIQQPQTQQPQTPQPPASPAPSSVTDLFSIDRIRKDLERRPSIAFTIPEAGLPRYRLEIQGSRGFKLPDWRSNLELPPMTVPQPLGGADYYEMQRLITPAQAWGSAPFSNSDLVKMYGLSGAYGLAGVLIKKGIEARQRAEAEKVRAEVQQELAEVEAHNARVAAGQADDDGGDAAKKAAQKKKQDEKNKKKKKDKDDGGK